MSYSQPFFFDLAEWVEAYCELNNMPALMLDYTEPVGESLCIRQTSAPVTEKEYINGSKQCRADFEIIAQGNTDDRLNLIRYLTTLCMLFDNTSDTQIVTGRTILRASATTPSIRTQETNGTLRYGISASVVYKEL